MAFQEPSMLAPAYESLHVGVAMYEPDTATVVDANDRLEAITGYSTDELRELSVDEYSANTGSFSAADFRERLRVAADGDSQTFTWRLKRSDGELVWARFDLGARTRRNHVYVFAEVRDVTESYTAGHRETLFRRVLRHNLRNKANVVTGWAEEVEAIADCEAVREAANAIQDAALDISDITDSVREIEQAAAADALDRRYRNAAAAVREIADEIRSEYPMGRVRIREHEEMWVHVDTAFGHALTHAIENAIVHSESGDPRVEITVGPSPNTGRVEIRISDENRPIPDDELRALDGLSETSTTAHGSGVGLFVMKWGIESLGGEVRFEHDGERGNTVAFYLPPKQPPDDTTS